MSAHEVILNVYWWTRFTGPEQTGTFVKIMGSGFQVQNLEGQVKPNRQKQTKSRNIRTIRIEIEREFSVEKRSYGLGLIVTRLETTQLTSIALSVLTANLFEMQRKILCAFLQFLEDCKRDNNYCETKPSG